MTAEYEMEGADKLREIARALRQLADKELNKDFYKRLNKLVKPLKASVMGDLKTFLPDRYAEELARDLKITSQRRTSRTRPGITMVAKARSRSRGGVRDLASLNRGRLRHPLFADREWWYDQKVKPGFFDEPIRADQQMAVNRIEDLLDEVAVEITRKIN